MPQTAKDDGFLRGVTLQNGDQGVTTLWVGHGQNGGPGDPGQGFQKGFDFLGKDVLISHGDHPARAAPEAEKAVLQAADLAHGKPAVAPAGRGGNGIERWRASLLSRLSAQKTQGRLGGDMVCSGQWRGRRFSSGWGFFGRRLRGIADEQVGASDPDLAALVKAQLDPGIGTADGCLRGGLVGQSNEAGLGCTVELSDPGLRGEGLKPGAEAGVQL